MGRTLNSCTTNGHITSDYVTTFHASADPYLFRASERSRRSAMRRRADLRRGNRC